MSSGFSRQPSVGFAIQLALFGVLAAFIIEMTQYWYVSDQYSLSVQQGSLTMAQAILYERAAYTVASVLRNGSLLYFLYAMNAKSFVFGEF